MKNNTLKILLAMYFVANSLSAKAADAQKAFVFEEDGSGKYCCCKKYDESLSKDVCWDLGDKSSLQELKSEETKIIIHKMRDFDDDDLKTKYEKSAQRLISVLNNGSFQQKLTTAIQNKAITLTETKIGNDDFANSQEIIKLLISGKVLINPTEDHAIDIDVTLYNKPWSRVIGYSNGTGRTWVNKKYLDIMTPNELAGHILHEYLHNVGFTHYKEHLTSVPYQLGKLLIDVLNESEEFKPNVDEIGSPQREGCLIS